MVIVVSVTIWRVLGVLSGFPLGRAHEGMATLVPSWSEIDRLPTPLTEGERHLVALLERELSAEWEVYVQPYLNGTRPDVVALHPTRGAIILEVKDWNLALYAWKRGEPHWRVEGRQGSARIQNPFRKVEHYRENILRFLVPQAGQALREQGWRALSSVRVGVYFHGASTAQVRRLTAGRVHDAVLQLGRDALVPGATTGWTPRGAGLLPAEFAAELRVWLHPPLHALEQASPVRLSREQERLARPKRGFHRVRGVAGSGKSLVLAERAARAALMGRRVLVVSFNITLWHLLRDGVRRAGGGAALGNVVFNHLHGLARDLAVEAGITWSECGTDVARVLSVSARKLGVRFDAVLVDEAQDYKDAWGEALLGLVREGGEFVAVVDELQNVYARPQAWLTDARFSAWAVLRESYRLHEDVILTANAFARAFLPEVGLMAEPRQGMLRLGNPEYAWQDMESVDAALDAAVGRVRELARAGVHPSDVAVLLPDHATGLAFVARMEALGVRVNHVFTTDPDDKRQKYAFWMGDSRLKACTVHSFKGWEAQHVVAVLATGEREGGRQVAMQAYTAITRARASLTVLNLVPAFRGFRPARTVSAA